MRELFSGRVVKGRNTNSNVFIRVRDNSVDHPGKAVIAVLLKVGQVLVNAVNTLKLFAGNGAGNAHHLGHGCSSCGFLFHGEGNLKNVFKVHYVVLL